MAMDPNYIGSPILPGYVYQGTFYPVQNSVQLGYWYNNAFYGREWIEKGYDFTQTSDAYPYSLSQTGYQQLPYGSLPGYSYLQTFYKTYQEATAYQQQLHQEYQRQEYQRQEYQRQEYQRQEYQRQLMLQGYQTMPPQVVPRSDQIQFLNTQDPPVRANPAMFTTIQDQSVKANPALFTTIQPQPQPKVSSQKLKKCSLCHESQPLFMEFFGQACCMNCLKTKYISNQLYFETDSSKLPWTAQLIYNIHTALRERLPLAEKNDLPSEIKLPLESTVCIGRREEVASGYPSKGHIVGLAGLCVGAEACPNQEHVLCKGCAKKLYNCPICNEKVIYEELPPCPPDCQQNHVGSFTEACPVCKKVEKRIKHQKAEEAKVEEKKT